MARVPEKKSQRTLLVSTGLLNLSYPLCTSQDSSFLRRPFEAVPPRFEVSARRRARIDDATTLRGRSRARHRRDRSIHPIPSSAIAFASRATPSRARVPRPRARPRTALVPRSNSLARAPRAHLAGSHAQVVNRNVRASPITSSALARVGRVHGVVATEIAARSRAMPRRFAPARALDRASRITRDIFTHVRGRVFPYHFTTPRARSDISRRKISFERSG